MQREAPPVLHFEERKRVRAPVVREWLERTGQPGCVCFSCGNASQALKAAGVYTVEIAPGGELSAGRWWQPWEIARAWPHLLDATSGHLPMGLLPGLAAAYRAHLGALAEPAYLVPTGSGETLLALQAAYPEIAFHPLHDCGRGTEAMPLAPLAGLVEAMRCR